MKNNKLSMSFDPELIGDLGAKLYSTLPPILAELIANGYDACAKNVKIQLFNGEDEKKIIISDDGGGMSLKEINEKYLHIGRKRRDKEGEKTKCGRLLIGKKGLGKLAFFGVSRKAVIESIKDNTKVIFEMDWEKIQNSGKIYHPTYKVINNTKEKNGTKITISAIHRKTNLDAGVLKKSIANYFIFDKDFKVFIGYENKKLDEITNEIRYQESGRRIDFSWEFPKIIKLMKLDKKFSFANAIRGKVILFNKPVRSSIRGVTLFSRKKLVNLPEFFPIQGSSYFFQYLTGYLEVDFIDEIKPDVISTNRSSLAWNDDRLESLKDFLNEVISYIHNDWRKRKKKKIIKSISEKLNINIYKWKESNKNNKEIEKSIDKLTKLLKDPENIQESELVKLSQIIYNLAPEHADFVLWSGLHSKIRKNSIIKEKFFKEKYLEAAREAVQIYNEEVQKISGSSSDGCSLMDLCFKKDKGSLIQLTSKSNESEENIDLGHNFLSKGVITGFRNPALGHTSLTKAKIIKVFSDRNCLDILNTISYLFDRLEKRKKP